MDDRTSSSCSRKQFSRRTVCKLTAGVGVLPLVTSSAAAENDTHIDVGAGENGFQFDPDNVVIELGTSVVWEWTGRGGGHNVVHDVDDPEFESERTAKDGYTFSHTFEEPGTYEYVCTPHRAQGMSGQVRVEEPPVDSPEEPTAEDFITRDEEGNVESVEVFDAADAFRSGELESGELFDVVEAFRQS